MDYLSNDMILYITAFINNHMDILHMKFVNKEYNALITSFYLKKIKLNNIFLKFTPNQWCINADCYDDTCEVYEEIYQHSFPRYIHYHQCALNTTNITINKKPYLINTPYCSECFTQYVLIGDNKNVKHNLIMDKVNIDYITYDE